jgi:2-polyprenyl-6-hydroxyphenyl methylase/3-demethylubiquinone-9 3-methyltransferase
MSAHPHAPSADSAEVAKFDASAGASDPQGEYRPLHLLNPCGRIYFGQLGGRRVLDVSCGGGLLAEYGRARHR